MEKKNSQTTSPNKLSITGKSGASEFHNSPEHYKDFNGTMSLREATLGIRSPLRSQIEALYKEKRDCHIKLQEETALRKSLEKQVKHLEAKLLR